MSPFLPESNVSSTWACLLLVNPTLLGAGPANNLVLAGEPQSNFLLGTLNSVTSVAHVAADIDGVVEANGSWGRGTGVGGTEDSTASLDDVAAFPDHGDDRSRRHVANETGEEWLCLQIFIMLLEMLLGGGDDFDSGELEALLLEAGDDVSNEATLDAIWLDGNESLLGSHFWSLRKCGIGWFKGCGVMN